MGKNLFVGLIALAASFMAIAAHAAPGPLDFNRDIRPILSDNCYACHGPDKNKRKAELRLDTKGGLFDEIDGVHPVTPGNLADSDLFQRLITDDPDDHMPPVKSIKKLTPAQIGKIKLWIEQGAAWKGHWAYIKPTRPVEPEVDAVAADVRNPIDKFILSDLRAQHIEPAPAANKITLCRRLYFDLHGLPPTPEQVAAFVNDPSPNAYDSLVDRLLADAHFGERLAVFWLDQVRYADTVGYHSDTPVNVWPYRDWVIAAFNQNMPFDQFTVEQLAGDLLPKAGTSQKVASAYNRLLQTTEEGGAQPREYEAKYAADRVRNVSAVWLAQTMGCCECHDHKFDPLATRDFYTMESFFADVQEASVGKREPGMPLPSKDQQAQADAFDRQIAAARAKLAAESPELAAAQTEWEKIAPTEVTWQPLDPTRHDVQGESKLKKLEGGILQTVYKVGANENYAIAAPLAGKAITGIRLEALADDALPGHGPGNSPGGNFVLSDVRVQASENGKAAADLKVGAASADFSQDAFPVTSVLDAKRKNKKNSGWAIYPQVGKSHEAVFQLAKPVDFAAGGQVTVTLQFQSQYPQHSIGRFRLSDTTAPEPARRTISADLRTALSVPADQRTAQQKTAIAAQYRSTAPQLQGVRDEIARLDAEKMAFVDALPKCLVTTAAPTPRTVRLLPRGNWLDSSGPVMAPAIPAAFGALPASSSRPTRLDLARWIVSADNPLTARVFVNRLWKTFYGAGIARKLDDFGSQGDWPTHPELLDWLASEFTGRHWDVKHMVRLMVTSAAYRRGSVATEAQKKLDPANLYFSHQNRFRVDAEFVRDTTLSVSGLLVNELGGKSVFPYQPAGYWSFLNFPVREWQNDKGDGLYRRGMYSHWQRTFPHPSLLAFDAPSREEATCERTRSNVPQQALVLLNDPTYVEAARVFAEHAMRNAEGIEARIGYLFQRALSRAPTVEESRILRALLEKHLKEYSADGAAAEKLVSAGDAAVAKDLNGPELAAWTNVARTIFNLHETIARN